MTSIYLAGKIGKNDWRHDVVTGLRGKWGSDGERPADRWPVLKKAVCGALDYTGPYAMSCDHGCAHEPDSDHGCGVNGTLEGAYPAPTREQIKDLCLDAIRRSDVVFAWLDDTTAYGTLVEIGYAQALGKRVLVGARQLPGDWQDPWGGHGCALSDFSPLAELWFAFAVGSAFQADDPAQAIRDMVEVHQRVNARTDSPIETAFWREHCRLQLPSLEGLVTQHTVGKYRLDFAIPARKFAIELDGYAYHSDKDSFVRDRARQRELESMGWRVVRFAGSEIRENVQGCVHQASELAAR